MKTAIQPWNTMLRREPCLDLLVHEDRCCVQTYTAEVLRGFAVGVSDPELREKLFGPRWVQYQHESEKRSWSRWKRLIHRLQRCPICKPPKKQDKPDAP